MERSSLRVIRFAGSINRTWQAVGRACRAWCKSMIQDIGCARGVIRSEHSRVFRTCELAAIPGVYICESFTHYTFYSSIVSKLSFNSSTTSKTPGRAIGTERVAEGIGCLCTGGDKASGVSRKPSTSLRLTESLE
jgi:hypothetical protein